MYIIKRLQKFSLKNNRGIFKLEGIKTAFTVQKITKLEEK